MKLFLMIFLFSSILFANQRFANLLCDQPEYYCIKIKAQDKWRTLFPDEQVRDLIRRLNRMNIPLIAGITLAIPKNIDKISIYDISPFPRYIDSAGEKLILIDQDKLAFAAYDPDGELIWWGPISSGAEHCPGVSGGCNTPAGAYRIIRKQDEDCISTTFPRRANGDSGGAQMPYCMHFFMGYALHGSEELPGFRASHGCIRMFTEDARWLNEEFVELPGGGFKGTRIIIN